MSLCVGVELPVGLQVEQLGLQVEQLGLQVELLGLQVELLGLQVEQLLGLQVEQQLGLQVEQQSGCRWSSSRAAGGAARAAGGAAVGLQEKSMSQDSLAHITGSFLSLELDLGPSILDDVLNIMDKPPARSRPRAAPRPEEGRY
ncbi:Cdc42 effector protein 3 [Liparis tanakae]|uniref:Cdc42 effector protein 3 n=1 Tax=Liparis tanakae TaxID=230148 RepID=A0A4Z2FCT7_9TELE|nr:Cdc42 effector protein 3 [Liparis tanakae]